MSREASYHWSFTLNFFSFLRQIHIYPSSSVFLPEKFFKQNWEILNLINAARLKKKKLLKYLKKGNLAVVPSYFCVMKNKMRSFWLVEREQC